MRFDLLIPWCFNWNSCSIAASNPFAFFCCVCVFGVFSQSVLLRRLLWTQLMRKSGLFILAQKTLFLRSTMEGMQILYEPGFKYLWFTYCSISYVYTLVCSWDKIQGHISRSLWSPVEIQVWSCWHMVRNPSDFALQWWILRSFASYWLYMIELAGMNIVSLMIWWLMHLKVKVAMFGHARIMMEMCKVIS